MSKKNTLDISNGWYKFLLTLSDALSPIRNSEEIMFKAVSLLGNYLGVERAFYCDMDTDGDNMWIRRDYVNNVESQEGYYHISDFDPFLLNEYRAGRTVVMDDAAVDTRLSKDERLKYLTVDIQSFVGVPLMKEDKLMSVLTVSQSIPRKWTEAEISIIEETAERTWAAVERAKAEGRIKESESLFRTMADASPVLIWTIEADGLSSYYNKTFRDFIGATKDEDISDWGKIVHPEDVQSTLDTINTAIAERRSYSIECRLLRADGQWRWLLVQGNPSVGANNEFLGFVGSSVDITERKQAEERIRESEAFSWSTLESSPDCVKVINTEGRVTYMNFNGLCTLEIDDFSEIKNKPWWSLWGKENEQTVKAAIAKSLNGETSQFQAMCPTAKGTNKWWDVLVSPVETPDGKISQLISVSRDITSQVEQGKKIAASEQNVRNLFMQAPAFICVLRGPNHVYELANERYLRLIGNRDILGKPVRNALPELEGQGFYELLDKVYATGEPFIGNELPAKLENGGGGLEEVYLNFVYQPSRNSEGEIDGILVHGIDVTEQVLARKTIEESESYFQRLTDTVPAIIWITQPDGSCSYLNKLWYDYTGQTEEEARGFGWLEATHPDDMEHVSEIFIKANSAQKPFSSTYRLRNSRGEYRWIADNGSPKFSADDVFEGMIGTVVDVHEEKLAEEKLAYRTALLEAHNEASVDGILLVDTKGKIISFNQRFIEIWNMPQHIVDAKDDEAALSFAMTQLVNPQLFIDKVKYQYEHKTEVCFDELDFINGKIVERNGYPVFGVDGNYYAWSWTFRDITKQKNYDKIIIESEQRFRTLAQTLPQLIWMTDEKGAYEYASNQLVDYSGLDPSVENLWGKLVHPDDTENLMQIWQSSLNTGKTCYTEARLKNKVGAYRWHLVQAEPIKNEKGNIINWIGAFTDIENLKKEQKQKDDFLSMASHELKTPVTTIKAYGQILERILDAKGDLETLGMVKKMGKQVVRLTTLISDLLNVSKMQKGGLIHNESVFNFNEMIKEVIDDMQKTIVTHQIMNNLDAEINILGDKDKLVQVLNNLISNATKYSPLADKIIVSTQIVNDGVQLSVQDFGIGISTDEQQNVFEQFYRVTGENQSTFQGMGIGLYICAEIIKREGGKIWMESAISKGSVFYVWLPIVKKKKI